jgi:hypothetical protein
VVFTGAKTAANPSGLPSGTSEMNAMMAALQAAYTGSDIKSNQNVATLMNVASGSFATFGTSVVSAQLGGNTVSGGGSGIIPDTLVSGACTGLPANAAFFNSTVSYSLTNASGGTSLNAVTAGYSASPATNTCQWKCGTGNNYVGGVCEVPLYAFTNHTFTPCGATGRS